MKNIDLTKHYEDGEILGLDKDGSLILWNSETKEPENCGETPEEFGVEMIRLEEWERIYGKGEA